MLRAATPLLVLVLMAGCLGGGEPEAPAAGAASDGPSLGVESGEAAEVTAENASEIPPLVPIATPVAYSGTAPVGVCQFIAGQCAFATAGSEDYHMLEVPGQAKTLALQVTYAGQAPGMDFYVGVCIGENEGSECLEYKTGPSPLVVEWDLSPYPPGTAFGISIGSVQTQATSTATMVFGPAEFDVAGTLTSLPIA